jgi:signal transduction histidine kinase/CheY-like chemotaxis protein
MTLSVAAVVTERRRVRHALRESERAYRQMFESNPHPMWIVDRETGRFLAVNDAAVDTYGYSRAELLAMTEGDLDSGRPGSVRHLTRDGRRVDVEITGHAITFAGRPASLVLAYDITDRRRDEEERRGLLEREQTARRQAEEANAAKDTFLATLSHELRTPLTTILGWARMLQDGQLASTQARHALQTIERNVRRQSQLINDLLDISRIVTGKLGLDSYRLDLVPVIEDAVDTLRRDAEARRLQLRTDLEFQAASVWGDPGRLHQVVVNLVSNALKFTPEGGQVDVRLDRLGDHALLTVRDSGKGIAPEALPHIFDRFRQADSSLTRRHGGLGLGLAIVREIVHLHGGTVEAESGGAGQGAAFRVRLPLAGRAGEPPGPHRPADATRLGAAMTGLLGMRVLVVDDDADTLDLLSTTLGPLHAGATVMTARSVLEALECFDRMAPDVVVTDLAMPDNDGYALLREVQARGWARDTTTPVVAMTAHAGAEDRERALAAGFAAYVPKPLELAQLIRLLARTAPVRAERP